MICPKCKSEQDDQYAECLKCGIIFEKYRQRHAPGFTTDREIAETKNPEDGDRNSVRKLFLFVKPEINPFFFAGRLAVFLVLFIWGWKFIFAPMADNYPGTCFLHLVNIPFHEAGHIIFSPFGEVVRSLGGSLAQLLVPAICLLVFLTKSRDTFGAAVSLWWFGENFMDIAPYINDARARELPLLGGNTGMTAPYGFHDWEFVLTESGWLRYDHILASAAHKIGIFLMILSLLWAGYLIFKQYLNLDRK